MKLLPSIVLAGALASCVPAQTTNLNPGQINFVAHFASPPAHPVLNAPYLFVDASTAGVCSGGGSGYAWCVWNGSTFVGAAGVSTGLGDPGSNSIPYRNGPGTTVPAIPANFPTLNQNTSGNAATATALQGTPTLCSSGQAAQGIAASGNAQGCTAYQGAFGSQTANYFYAAPDGSAGSPLFRAIVAADIPTLNQNTTGSAANVTGVVARANGGLNSNSAGTGFLRDGTTPTAGELSGDCTTSASFAVTCTNISHVSAGVLAIANGGTGAATATNNYVFAGPGSGGSGAPAFRALVAADVPTLNYVQLSGDLGNTNASPQVVSTHLAAGLPRAQGGLGTTSPGTGFFRDASTPTQGELSGDITTSGSYATTLATVNSGPGACGDSTHVCQVTTNGKGLVTGQSAVSITVAGTINAAAQYDLPYYSGSGSSTTLSGAAVSGVVAASAGAAPTAATSHNLSAILVCADSSGSTALKSCSTTPTFTPANGDEILFSSTTSNSAQFKVSVNGSAAAYVLIDFFYVPTNTWPTTVLIPLIYEGGLWFALFPTAPTPDVQVYNSGPVTDPGQATAVYANNIGGSGAITFNLPTLNINGLQRCYRNWAGNTGVITVAVGTGDVIDLGGTDGTTSSGTLTSGGALGDEVCLTAYYTGLSRIWLANVIKGSWTNH